MEMKNNIKLDDKKSIFAWTLYDWANSAFSTTVAAGFFPLFFGAYWAFGEESILSTLAYANSAASLLVAIMAPFLGAIADRMSGKKKFLFFFAFLGIIMTGALWLLQAGMWPYAIAFFVTATIGFSGANIFYDALLTGVASEKKVDYVSSLGFALGYIGGGLLFTVNVLMYVMPDLFGFQVWELLPDGTLIAAPMAIRVSFLSVAIWWAIFSIPIFIFVKEPRQHEKVGVGQAIKQGFKQLGNTFREMKSLKWVLIFLFGYWFYIDGVDTVIAMAVAIGDDLGFNQTSLIIALLMVQFIAFPGTLAYNWFAKKIGIKWGIFVAILAYCGLVIFGFFMQTTTHFFILAALIGPFQGGIQALSRSFYSRLTPTSKSGEFFGFYNMLGKFAAVIGPFLVGIVKDLTGSTRYAILSILILFIIGGTLFMLVNQKEGERLAAEKLSKPLNE